MLVRRSAYVKCTFCRLTPEVVLITTVTDDSRGKRVLARTRVLRLGPWDRPPDNRNAVVLESAIARHILPEDFLSYRGLTGRFSGETHDPPYLLGRWTYNLRCKYCRPNLIISRVFPINDRH